MGLAEFAYPRSWACLPHGNFRVYGPTAAGSDAVHYLGMYTVPDLRYDSPSSLIDAVNSKLSEVVWTSANASRAVNKITLDLLPDGRCKVKLPEDEDYMLVLSGELSNPLGFGYEKEVYLCKSNRLSWILETERSRLFMGGPRGHIKSPFAVKVDRLVSDLYLYADIVEPQLVGDSLVPLLRTVADTSTNSGEIVTADFRQIHYIPLTTGFFESIDIRIADTLGRPVRFLFGEITVKLHFRRRPRS